MAIFHRPELAARLVGHILGGQSTGSGLFLAAPRRTGKSTFLREDLRPALQAAGAKVLYVDLWADKKADPGQVIVAAIRAALAETQGVVTRLAKAAGMEKAAVGGLTFSLDRVGLGAQVSLTQALAALSDEIRVPVVLIMDEAQHAVTSAEGNEAMFALKAARDELNSSAHHGLRIVATGSNRDKLAMLRNSKEQAFFGAPLINFPALDKHYVQWFCDTVNLPVPLDPEVVGQLFVGASSRPEILAAAADATRLDLLAAPEDLPGLFARSVTEQIAEADAVTLRVVQSLTPLQAVVLMAMALQRERFSPFQADTIDFYRRAFRQMAPTDTLVPDGSNVQQALSALQDKGLIWKETRGVYALEDPSLIELMERHGLLEPLRTV